MASPLRNVIMTEIALILRTPVSCFDLDRSFIHHGGNSLSAILLSQTCKSYGVLLGVKAILLSPSIRDLMEQSMQALLSDAQQLFSPSSCWESPSRTRGSMVAGPASGIVPGPRYHETSFCGPMQQTFMTLDIDEYPMTEMQLSLVYGTRKTPGTNIVRFYEAHQTKYLPNIKRAWQVVVETEPIFRTSLLMREGKGCLVEQEEAQFRWCETTVSSEQEYNRHLQLGGSLMDLGTSFHVVTRLDSAQCENISTVIWIVHHALIDDYSSRLILQKVRMAAAGEPIRPGPSFAIMAGQLRTFQQRSSAFRRLFWKKTNQKYCAAANGLRLPKTHLQAQDTATSRISLQLPQKDIVACARFLGITVASFYYAAWALTLSKYADSDLVVFGVLLSGRDIPLDGVDEVIGPLINLLPLHLNLDRASTTVDYLQATFSRVIDLMDVSWSHPDDGFDRRFSSALAIRYEDSVAGIGSTVSPPRGYSQVRSDMPLYLLGEADGLCWLNYHTNMYEKHHVEILGESFGYAIRALMEPRLLISECFERLISQSMRSELYTLGQCSLPTTTDLLVTNDLVTLFEQMVARFPALIAVQKGNKSISYAALSESSHHLGNQLSTLVTPGEVVCVRADRSINWIIAVYGVLKARAVYCPFDQHLPASIRDANFKAAKSRLYLTTAKSDKIHQPADCAMCVSVEELLSSSAPSQSTVGVAVQQYPGPKTNAYLCFTSGSTGVPKGVMCRHESLVAFQSDLEVRLLAGPCRKIAQTMSPAFDGSIHEMFSALSYGATLLLEDGLNPFAHLQSADSAVMTPSLAAVLDPADFRNLKTVGWVVCDIGSIY